MKRLQRTIKYLREKVRFARTVILVEEVGHGDGIYCDQELRTITYVQRGRYSASSLTEFQVTGDFERRLAFVARLTTQVFNKGYMPRLAHFKKMVATALN